MVEPYFRTVTLMSPCRAIPRTGEECLHNAVHGLSPV
ncbi:hypothetical protein SAMN04489716_5007 [Actinoplanes derwentensis]|uniref:Uncharacterized protein n=1 Tax=Actinoplanes derwentensis TaxID=113562 RepID=A0A1H2BY52_9ACTN|nr:hypothetical protein SAMN04489716_5007 [Actinoplanes derwentensis]